VLAAAVGVGIVAQRLEVDHETRLDDW
jgi:hypothetical protein